MEEDGEGRKEGEGEGEEELNPKITAKPSISPPDVDLPHLVATSPSPRTKKGTGRRKKNSLSAKQRKVAEERLLILNKNFRPVPFSPGKTLDFSEHEQLFQALGLWDFAHLQLGEEVRPDLLADLIAYYDSSSHRSYVQGTRISVSRVDLARAIGLATKKEKTDAFLEKDWMQELVSAKGANTALLDFMFNYMLFEELLILPSEVVQAIDFVKEGVPYKVDWAAVMWVLVEKELKEGLKSGTFCYASHLQRLIEHQRPQLFSKEPDPVFLAPEPEEEEVSVPDEAVNVAEDEADAAEEVHLTEEDGDADIRKTRSLQDLVDVSSERHDSELCLILGDNVMDDFDDCKVNVESEWLQEGKNEGFEQCLRRCNSKASDSMDFENLAKMDEDENVEERFANGVLVKFSNFERLNPSDLLQEMNNVSIPYAAQVNSFNPSSGVLLSMRTESHKNDILDRGSSGSIYFGYNGKRHLDEIGDEERDHFEQKCHQNRMRTCEPWANLSFSFDDCMNQVQGGVKRAKILYSEKEQEVAKMEEQLQYLNHLVHDKELTIHSLKMMLEGQQNWQMAVRHYEHELCLVTQMMLGYKRALKESRGRFADYRKQHPRDDESLYKDLPGTGGLVVSAREFEKNRLVKEEEKREELLKTFGNLEQILNKLEKCEDGIMTHDSKLRNLVGEMEQLKACLVKPSCLDA
ncbi:uncharacterized protein LOC110103011 [Dendrobium catenatum]|uniref:uncharacterized protein LOC110103011 n=1 Tax=Dendrobium catenatum TaxID=906689 RepID=UPI00109F7E2F|nr:uncharacterized protein LOC110103011 [Dendrobium catenatum]